MFYIDYGTVFNQRTEFLTTCYIVVVNMWIFLTTNSHGGFAFENFPTVKFGTGMRVRKRVLKSVSNYSTVNDRMHVYFVVLSRISGTGWKTNTKPTIDVLLESSWINRGFFMLDFHSLYLLCYYIITIQPAFCNYNNERQQDTVPYVILVCSNIYRGRWF